jgi:hypothetical protein
VRLLSVVPLACDRRKQPRAQDEADQRDHDRRGDSPPEAPLTALGLFNRR